MSSRWAYPIFYFFQKSLLLRRRFCCRNYTRISNYKELWRINWIQKPIRIFWRECRLKKPLARWLWALVASIQSNVVLMTLYFIRCMFVLIRNFHFSGENADDGERKKTKMPGSQDDNIVGMLTSATNNVVGKVGDMVGKGIGGISTKFGTGSWF